LPRNCLSFMGMYVVIFVEGPGFLARAFLVARLGTVRDSKIKLPIDKICIRY